MKDRIQYKSFMISFQKIILIFIFFTFPLVSFAGMGAIKVNTPEKGSGVYEIAISIDTKGEEYNAIEGEVFYNKDLIDISNLITANSIVTVWLIEPKAVDGKIEFSGVMPNGFEGVSGDIFKIYATAKKDGNVEISFSGKSYLNDGKGTIQEISFMENNFAVVKLNKPEILTKLTEDKNSPIILQSVISQNEAMFGGSPFLIVHAKDGESGVSSYEFALSKIELKKEDVAKSEILNWQTFSSPTVLSESFVDEFVYVRIKDQSGNAIAQIVSVPRQLSPESWNDWLKEWWGLGIIALSVLGLLWMVLRRYVHVPPPVV